MLGAQFASRSLGGSNRGAPAICRERYCGDHAMEIWLYLVGALVLVGLGWFGYSVFPDIVRYIHISRM
jgi:hypothetical protein